MQAEVAELLHDLNPTQREAVLHAKGPLLVLAGAGSGKTRVIVHRVAHLVRAEKVMPWHILAVTFTNKAAGEMQKRLEALLGNLARELWVMTFHAFGARFLRREAARAGLPPAFAIYDDDDQARMVKGIFAELGIGEDDRFTVRKARSHIDHWKGAGLVPGEVATGAYDVEAQTYAEVYRRYEKALARAGAVDFGDLLLKPLRLLEKEPDLRQKWSQRFRHLLVDEFQDTNAIQFRLVKLLAGESRNVCVVGDDDQSIYRWRGADVSNILDFDKALPGTRVVKLEQNYRSTRTVLEAAHAVISRATRRREKKLWTEEGEGDPLALIVGQDEHDEALRVARGVAAERARGTRGDEIAVLYRLNAQSRSIEAALLGARIPYVIVRGTSFYERAEVRDAAAYLRLALNPRSDLDLLRVINRPPRGIGDRTVERLRAHAEEHGIPLYEALADREAVGELKPAARRALGAFHDLIADLNARVGGLDAGVAVQEALQKSGLLEKYQAEEQEGDEDRAKNLLELVAAARELDEALVGEPPPRDPDEPQVPPLARFLEQIALLGEADAPTPEGRVALMTLHAAKGLEFEAVFLCGMEDGTLPLERPGRFGHDSPEERGAALDEERRLCYVGMTRAKRRLTLSLARRRLTYGESGPGYREMEPSRFLGDLPRELFGPEVARAAAARAPTVRRAPGALPGEPHYEYDEEVARPERTASGYPPRRDGRAGAAGERAVEARQRSTPARGVHVDYGFDQRAPGEGGAFRPGERVVHGTLGEGVVRSSEGGGRDAKVTVAFFAAGEKRVLARFLARAG